jgi:hypothetical protein
MAVPSRPLVLRLLLLAPLALAACGDPPTDDRRGYTKAPLERPGPLIRGEEPSEMAELGEPIRPAVREIRQSDLPQAN